MSIRGFHLHYHERDRDCLNVLMRGIFHDNPFLYELSLVSKSHINLINVNKFVESTETYKLSPLLKNFELRDGIKYSERTKFLENGTLNLERLSLNKTILL